ncbi:MAG: GNAT family N-acetyltransferase, partial [Pseudomonadota bacterium]|nr:GNAT family N-acetyltransferase [Pseudomonadota bacterium]
VVLFRAEQNPLLFSQVCRLRYRVFCEYLGWTIPHTDLLEFDEFDTSAIHCALVEAGSVVGGWRALPTTSPYLLEKYFAILLRGEPPPHSKNVWEISRFAIDPYHQDRWEFGKQLAHAFVDFGSNIGATELIGVTEPAFERFLRAAGLVVKRTSGPVVMGYAKGKPVQTTLISCPIPNRVSSPLQQQAVSDFNLRGKSHVKRA